jgi:predicted RNA binding protein YcfA (HicA-like mRNA interferase family)
MKSGSGKELARVAERHGWRLLRVHGSHHIYGKSGSVVRLSIPIHGNRPLKVDLLA